MTKDLKFDSVGQAIQVGDTVVFGQAGSMRLFKGVVSKINDKTVTIEHEEYANGSYSTIKESRRAFADVVVYLP